MEPIKYEYMRTITKENEHGDELFVGYISLTKYRLIKQQPYLQYDRAEQLNSTFIRKLQDTPALIAQLPEGDITYQITEEMYIKLANSFFSNQEWLWTYMAPIQT